MKSLLTFGSLILVVACGNETGPTEKTNTPDSYSFESRFMPGELSVSYSGQVLRNVLIADMFSYSQGLTSLVDNDETPENLIGDLLFYYDFDENGNDSKIVLEYKDISKEQNLYNDISSAKNLSGKIAGNDSMGQHKDWNTEFVGWPGAENPDTLIRIWVEQIDELATSRQTNASSTAPDGNAITDVYVTPTGLDLAQLIQKFQYTAIGFSQAADDYLDNDLDDHGLNVSNEQDEDSPYSLLEHHWDEAFGYFGAARSYGTQSKSDIIEFKYDDADSNGSIDLKSEAHYGVAVNAVKRDEGATTETSFSDDAWSAFLSGRNLIANAGSELTASEKRELIIFRDQAINAWEATIAATVVHYINDVFDDMSKFETDDYVFEDHAKHWSELKGYAFAFQFNPRSPLSDDEFADMHTAIGMAPVLNNASLDDIAEYKNALQTAKDILKEAYGFTDENVETW